MSSKRKRKGPVRYAVLGAAAGGLATSRVGRAAGTDIKEKYRYYRQPVSKSKFKENLARNPEAQRFYAHAKKTGNKRAMATLKKKLGGTTTSKRVKPWSRYKTLGSFQEDQLDLLRDSFRGRYDSLNDAQIAFTKKFHSKYSKQQQMFLRGLSKPLKHRGKIVLGATLAGAVYGFKRREKK